MVRFLLRREITIVRRLKHPGLLNSAVDAPLGRYLMIRGVHDSMFYHDTKKVTLDRALDTYIDQPAMSEIQGASAGVRKRMAWALQVHIMVCLSCP